ncbi:lysosome-associated membrane glycoprotein 1 [Bicyclus anynana]|uniref:Lysosome-associated membrane glycoprotein 1 n=1 Tax=Bicyclus anynana TaxID=110368 RepID=A0ABM3LUJ4_BICAN|nr:lysosome-associated membrane glycoprotein 1 [Bicyclus anynana]
MLLLEAVKKFPSIINASMGLPKLLCILLVVCSVQSLQLDSQASTRKPRVTKYSKTTAMPGGSTEPATERSVMTATYRLYGSGGETCILLTVDALLDISYVTKLNERADANTFVPNNANVAGACKESDLEVLVLSFKEFALEWTFAKTPGGERWYVDSIRITYNSSARILEHAAKQGRRVTLTTGPRALLFPTPVGKSFFCPDETVIDILEEEPSNPTLAHRAKLYLRQMRLQAFMFKRDGEFGPPWHCSDSTRARSETAPVAVGATLACATAFTLFGYTVWRYIKVKKVQYDTME